jgi:hypothetical protein
MFWWSPGYIVTVTLRAGSWAHLTLTTQISTQTWRDHWSITDFCKSTGTLIFASLTFKSALVCSVFHHLQDPFVFRALDEFQLTWKLIEYSNSTCAFVVSAIHIFSRLHFTYYILFVHGHANWNFQSRNCLQIKFRLSRDFVEFLQVNFATSTHPFASILRWLFSITHCLQIFAIFRTQRVCFYIHFSGRSWS